MIEPIGMLLSGVMRSIPPEPGTVLQSNLINSDQPFLTQVLATSYQLSARTFDQPKSSGLPRTEVSIPTTFGR